MKNGSKAASMVGKLSLVECAEESSRRWTWTTIVRHAIKHLRQPMCSCTIVKGRSISKQSMKWPRTSRHRVVDILNSLSHRLWSWRLLLTSRHGFNIFRCSLSHRLRLPSIRSGSVRHQVMMSLWLISICESSKVLVLSTSSKVLTMRKWRILPLSQQTSKIYILILTQMEMTMLTS